MKIDIHSVIGDIVAKNYKTAEVFRSYGVDFCCKGNRTINDLNGSKKIDIKKLINDLEKASLESNDSATDYNSWPLDLLADYIEKKYHRYIEEKTSVLKEYLTKVCKVHGHMYPELFQIDEIFNASSDDLHRHMQKEEIILFPYIRKMIEDDRKGLSYSTPPFGSIKNPISMMMDEHSTEGDRYQEISSLSSNYIPPANACNTYLVTFAMLQEFEHKLHEHIHLENNILFPGAIKFEEVLTHHLN